MRCKICNERLTTSELLKIERRLGTHSDTCSRCDVEIWSAYSEYGMTEVEDNTVSLDEMEDIDTINDI